jgi:hypothetical protein
MMVVRKLWETDARWSGAHWAQRGLGGPPRALQRLRLQGNGGQRPSGPGPAFRSQMNPHRSIIIVPSLWPLVSSPPSLFTLSLYILILIHGSWSIRPSSFLHHYMSLCLSSYPHTVPIFVLFFLGKLKLSLLTPTYVSRENKSINALLILGPKLHELLRPK